jgi:hypothetical protein
VPCRTVSSLAISTRSSAYFTVWIICPLIYIYILYIYECTNVNTYEFLSTMGVAPSDILLITADVKLLLTTVYYI